MLKASLKLRSEWSQMSIRSGFSPRWNQYFVEMHQNSSLTQYILIKSYQIILESLVLLFGYINFYKNGNMIIYHLHTRVISLLRIVSKTGDQIMG